jgi:hypothetical protein
MVRSIARETKRNALLGVQEFVVLAVLFSPQEVLVVVIVAVLVFFVFTRPKKSPGAKKRKWWLP